jgi:hypothetical protein
MFNEISLKDPQLALVFLFPRDEKLEYLQDL